VIPEGTPVKFAMLRFFEKFNWAGKGSRIQVKSKKIFKERDPDFVGRRFGLH
jgi:hypothetical protein